MLTRRAFLGLGMGSVSLLLAGCGDRTESELSHGDPTGVQVITSSTTLPASWGRVESV